MVPFAVAAAFHVLVPDAGERLDWQRIGAQARTFLQAEISPPAGDPVTEVDVGPVGGSPTRVSLRTVPLEDAPEIREQADRGVRAIGGAGFDALVARAKRVWQVGATVDGDARAPLVLAAAIASVMLGPIVPPDEVTIFGVRGARVRLEARGWPDQSAA
ncbi:MAG: hypothetical protein HYV09_32160 [Deltaproteobacteria bacterium]|nr:hypothetical protein [Deltaproteobacteria bacterium]